MDKQSTTQLFAWQFMKLVNHNVYICVGNEEVALKPSEDKQTMLTAWFDFNNRDPNAKHYL